MKLTTDQVEAKMTAAWGRQAFVVAHRICGNRLSYVATDHQDHWLPLLRTWENGRAVFEPVAARWPEEAWADAVLEAVEMGKDQGNVAYTFPLQSAGLYKVPPGRLERPRTAPEAAALSAELRGHV
jgi:hypothetical protein